MDLEITPTIKIPDAELRLSFARSSGPGGQNVNKVSSKAVLHFDVLTTPSLPPDVRQRFLERYQTRLTNAGEVVIHSEEYRDQPRNIQACYEKLRQMVLTVLRPPKTRATRMRPRAQTPTAATRPASAADRSSRRACGSRSAPSSRRSRRSSR